MYVFFKLIKVLMIKTHNVSDSFIYPYIQPPLEAIELFQTNTGADVDELLAIYLLGTILSRTSNSTRLPSEVSVVWTP